LLPAVPFTPAGTSQRTINLATVPGNRITPFTTWHFQCKFRDIAGGGALFNSSNGLAVTFCP
jgi:hypothetical protein